ncbi:MAG: M20 family metallopeptidase [Actinomycetota bacterium]|nr:M20 family metallopeptidase [Actinomycetota bacterium]
MSDTAVRDQAREHFDEAVSLRRTLHQHPEQGNELPTTRETVLEALGGLPLDISLHDTTSGFTALLTGDVPGPTILLRADMDALPLHEDTGLEFSSRDDESMHACGHDTHTAMLVAAARVLTDRRGELAGRVLFMFQPGEEGHHGARFMLDEGLLAVPDLADGSASPVDAAFAMHITSALPTGFVATRPGPIMASADRLQITITGRGGHASEPYRAADPIPVACEIVQALQTMVTRSIDVFDPSVVTIARMSAGTTNNVIPESAEIEGTIRAVSEDTRGKVHDGIRRVVDGIAAAHGVSATTEVEPGYPVTVNDDSFAAFAAGTATDVVGQDRFVTLPHPVMGAEDFSYVLHEVPGTMMFLGATPHSADLATAAPNHSNRVFFEEAAMRDGIAVYSAVALAHLARGDDGA